ncbi:hypothetical protein DDN05_17860 [Vibrio cholerae]|nr:hypothetical protein [Vibrio cholerae]
MDLVEAQKWLMETIWGIITLGAFGSLLGAFLLYMLKTLLVKFNRSKESLIRSLLYPIFKHSLHGEAMRDQLAPKSADAKYLVYHIENASNAIMSFTIFLVCFSFLGHVLIAYGLERPLLLSFLIAVNILTFYSALNSMMYSDGHLDDEIRVMQKKIEKCLPKNYKEYDSLSE